MSDSSNKIWNLFNISAFNCFYFNFHRLVGEVEDSNIK